MEEIKLVIKIPEEIRLALINNVELSTDQQSICDSCIKQAVINGTPLLKGYGRLMDADEFINTLKGIEKLHIDDELRNNILDTINNNILVES